MHEDSGSATSAATPVKITLRASPRARRLWRINHVGPAASKVALYIGMVNPNQFRDGSSSGEQDVAEYPNGLAWPAGSPLIWQWDTAGSAYVHVEYDYLD